jgi:hypothetical protein
MCSWRAAGDQTGADPSSCNCSLQEVHTDRRVRQPIGAVRTLHYGITCQSKG